MECPYLSNASDEKVCRLMARQGLDGELDDFDLTHYCKESPNHCYFYRLCSIRESTEEQLGDSKPEKIKVAFYDELSKLELGEAQISVDLDESPLYIKIIKRGIRYKVKPEFVDRLVARLRRK